MKRYTILQAIKELPRLNKEFHESELSLITYEDGSKNKFVVEFEKKGRYFINLNNDTYAYIGNR